MNAKELGIFSKCLEIGLPHDAFREYQGFHEVWDSNQVKEAALTVKSMYTILDKYNLQDCRLHDLTKSASVKYDSGEWDQRCKIVADGITDVLAKVEHVKEAAAAAAGLGIKTILGLSAATGIGAGALYWALKRNSEQDSLPNEKLRNQIDYYRNLSKDMESSIQRRMDQEAGAEAEAL